MLAWGSTLDSKPNRLGDSKAPARGLSPYHQNPEAWRSPRRGSFGLRETIITLMLPCRQCSRSLPEGSSVKRAKPEWDDFLMPVSWFRRWRNSSTVEEPSKPTTCTREVLVPEEISREELIPASGRVYLGGGKAWLRGARANAKAKGSWFP